MAGKQKPKTPDLTIPDPAEFPDVREARAKYEELGNRRKEIAGRVEMLRQKLMEPAVSQRTRVDADAAALIEGGSASTEDQACVREDHAQASRDLAVTERALQLQRDEIERLIHGHAEEVSRRLKPDYDALVAEVTEHAAAIDRIYPKLEAFCADLQAQGLADPRYIVGCQAPGLVRAVRSFLVNSAEQRRL